MLDGDGPAARPPTAPRACCSAAASQPGARCCALLGCRPRARCVTRARARARRGALPSTRSSSTTARRRWVVGRSPTAAGPGRGHAAPARRARRARARGPAAAAGRARARAHAASSDGGDASAERVARPPARPGAQVPVCERGRVVPLEELLEVFWPRRGPRRREQRPPGDPHAARPARARPAQGHARRATCVARARRLRARARPRRDRRRRLRGARARRAGRAPARRRPSAPTPRSPRPRAAYGGNFLADEPYAEWALAERERLRDLAAQVLRGLPALKRAAGDEDAAAEHLQRLVELEPLDLRGAARPARADAAPRPPLRGAAPLRARPPPLQAHVRHRARLHARGTAAARLSWRGVLAAVLALASSVVVGARPTSSAASRAGATRCSRCSCCRRASRSRSSSSPCSRARRPSTTRAATAWAAGVGGARACSRSSRSTARCRSGR